MEIRRGRPCIGLVTLKMPVSTTLPKVKDLHQPTTMPQPTPLVEEFHVCMERTGRNPDWSRSRHVLLLEGCKKWCKRDLVHSLSMTSKLYACFQLFSNAFCQGGNAYCNFSAVSALKRTVEINSQSRSSSVVVTAATSEGASCKAQRLAAAHHVLHSQTYCRLQVWPVFMCR